MGEPKFIPVDNYEPVDPEETWLEEVRREVKREAEQDIFRAPGYDKSPKWQKAVMRIFKAARWLLRRSKADGH